MRAPPGENEPEPKRLPSSGDLQPRKSDPELSAGLEEFENTEAARRLQRLVEHEIVLELQLQKFDTSTPEWRVFASALAEYGYSVFKGWLISGVVHGMAARHAGGRGVFGIEKIPEGLRLRPDDAHAVAAELVIRSIAAFRDKTLMNPNPSKRWRPDGGASIKTFFVGRCLMELPDLYQRWARQERRFARQGARYAAWEKEGTASSHVDTEASASAAAHLERIRAMSDETTMVMFELQVAGYTYDEIAEMLSSVGVHVTTAQVRTRISRTRAALRRHR
jgi:hypothetical protein